MQWNLWRSNIEVIGGYLKHLYGKRKQFWTNIMPFSQKLIAVRCLSVQKTWRFRWIWRGPYFKSKRVWIIVLGQIKLICWSTGPANAILKVMTATFLLVCFLSLKESTCKTWKTVFYFISKAFVPKKIKF